MSDIMHKNLVAVCFLGIECTNQIAYGKEPIK